ncbi:hypothetical protein MTO96_025346 [Rhipicephalus appendiculatus]
MGTVHSLEALQRRRQCLCSACGDEKRGCASLVHGSRGVVSSHAAAGHLCSRPESAAWARRLLSASQAARSKAGEPQVLASQGSAVVSPEPGVCDTAAPRRCFAAGQPWFPPATRRSPTASSSLVAELGAAPARNPSCILIDHGRRSAIVPMSRSAVVEITFLPLANKLLRLGGMLTNALNGCVVSPAPELMHWQLSVTFAGNGVVIMEGDRGRDGRLLLSSRVSDLKEEWGAPQLKRSGGGDHLLAPCKQAPPLRRNADQRTQRLCQWSSWRETAEETVGFFCHREFPTSKRSGVLPSSRSAVVEITFLPLANKLLRLGGMLTNALNGCVVSPAPELMHWQLSATFAGNGVVIMEGDRGRDGRLLLSSRVSDLEEEWVAPQLKRRSCGHRLLAVGKQTTTSWRCHNRFHEWHVDRARCCHDALSAFYNLH